MDTQTKVVFISTLAFSLLFINVAKSHQVLQWQPSTAKKLGYLAIIWLLPLVGALMVHFLMDMNWINKKLQQQTDSDTIAGDAMLGIDAIVNPGQRHVQQAKQEVIVEQKRSDEPELKMHAPSSTN